MKVEEFQKVLEKSLSIIEIGIKKGYFKEEDKKVLTDKLLKVLKNGIVKDIHGNAIYGVYVSNQQRLYYNAKVFKNEQEALIYVLHEMKHALDDNEKSIGFDSKIKDEGTGINEGATQRFATDLAEEILQVEIPKTEQTSLGIMLNTNLDEYQIEDKMNELICNALGISRADFLKKQNQNDGNGLLELKEKFDEFADFDTFLKALDEIYSIQEETWIDEDGNLLEQEAEPTKEQTEKAKVLIRICQEQVVQYVEKANPERLEEIKENMIMIDEKIMSDNAMITQEDYMRYEEYISSLVDVGDSKIVYISGLEDHSYEPIKGAKADNIIEILENGGSISESVYFRDGDTYKQMNFTLDAKNGISQGAISDVKDLSDITVEINSHGFLGNPEEYIRMLRIQGKEEFANEKQREYEYFMNNREKMPELLQKGYDTRESDELAEALYNGEFVGESIDIDFSEFEKGTIEYKGISISDDGLIYGVNEYGEITREAVSEEVISEIEESVKRGEISLNEEQRQTLLNAKQNIKQNEKIGQEEFRKVAESSIEEKEQTFHDLRMATQEREQEERNYNEQGE